MTNGAQILRFFLRRLNRANFYLSSSMVLKLDNLLGFEFGSKCQISTQYPIGTHTISKEIEIRPGT